MEKRDMELDGALPLASIGLKQEPEIQQNEADECNEGTTISDAVDIKCEFESDPEYDEELRRINLEKQRGKKIEPTDRDFNKDGAERAEPNREHAGNSTGNRWLQCTVCHKLFSQSNSMKKHLKAHCIGESRSSLKPACEKHKDHICQRQFPKANQAHVINDGDINLKEVHVTTHTCDYQCLVCNKRVIKSRLDSHSIIHTEKHFECNDCGRHFLQKGRLRTHMKSHTDEKPFECYFCDGRFRNQSNLQSHMKTHTGERPYECSFCKRCFFDNCTLKRHIRIHTGEKPYECDVCQRRFAYLSALRSHRFTHTGEKPFKCHVCEFRCARKAYLRIHSHTHTVKKRYECQICHKDFANKWYLEKHMVKHSKSDIIYLVK